MCNLQKWTFVDAYGQEYPQERLYPCSEATPQRTPCVNLRTFTLNDQVVPPHVPRAPVVTTQPGGANTDRKAKKKAKNDDLRLEWSCNIGGPSKKTPPTPTTPVNAGTPVAASPLIRLDRPLIPQTLPLTSAVGPAALPPVPPTHYPAPRVEYPARPNVIEIEPGRGSPRRSSRTYEIREPTREHHRRSPRGEPRPSSGHRRQSYYRVHDRRRQPARQEPRQERQSRTPSPVRERRLRAERDNQRREAAIQAEIDRLNSEVDRYVREREQLQRDRNREAELRRMDQDIQDLRNDVERQYRALRQVRPVIHQDDDYDDRGDRPDFGDRGGYRSVPPRERSSSETRGRWRPRVHFADLGRRLSRSADRGGRRQSQIEERPRDESPIPVRDGRGVSGLRQGWFPFRRDRDRDRDRAVYDDEDRRGGRRRWF